MAEVVVLALTAAVNPTEIAAIAVMLLLPRPERLMLGYWLGAMLTGVASGSVIVFALEGTSAEHTTRHTVGPVVWLVFAALLVIAAIAVARGEDTRMRDRHRERHPQKERRHRSGRKRCARGTPGTRSWSGSCSRSQGPPTSPRLIGSSTCTTRPS